MSACTSVCTKMFHCHCGITSDGSEVLGLRTFGACSALSVYRQGDSIVEGWLVWRLVAGKWAFVVSRFGMLIRYTH